jgi:hypothetical protein
MFNFVDPEDHKIKILLYYIHALVRILNFNFFQHVAVIVQNEICWISLTERKHANDNGIVYKAPIFVAHFPGQPYLFISHSGKKEDILNVVSLL